MLVEARRQVSEVGVADFSVRELAKALGLVPGTVHARFGNKHQLLALLYLQRIEAARDMLADLPAAALCDVNALLEHMSPHLSTLRREFVLHFEGNGRSGPRLRSSSWEELKSSFRGLAEQLYACFREAAGNEGIEVVESLEATRLFWTLASTMDSVRSSVAFDHADSSYRRLVAHSLLASLAK